VIRYKNEKQTRIAVGITMFMYAFFSTAYVQLTAPILAYMVEAEGYTDPILSNMIVTICALAQIPACLLGVALGKRMDKKLWSYIGMACFLFGSLLIIPFSQNIYLVLLCRFVVGFGSGILILLCTVVMMVELLVEQAYGSFMRPTRILTGAAGDVTACEAVSVLAGGVIDVDSFSVVYVKVMGFGAAIVNCKIAAADNLNDIAAVLGNTVTVQTKPDVF